ncbi:hypothetical protein ABZ816_00555 [Actinosynnema sp. NPDC047251]|uniref:hypothetical protein n=1 Tax=Saccharothrix espanaensis TaxID=103731 RepID=UPI0002E2500B|nr:hypothetical protein [Saccharothrix espanaensis]
MTRSDDSRPPTPAGAAGGPSGAHDGWFDTALPFVPPESAGAVRLPALTGSDRAVAGSGGAGSGTGGAVVGTGGAVAGTDCAVAARPDPGPPGDGWFDPALPAGHDFPAEGPHPFLARALAERAARLSAPTDQNSREA